MAEQYVSKTQLLGKLEEYREVTAWNTDKLDDGTILAVLTVVINIVNGLEAIGPRKCGNRMLEAQKAAVSFLHRSFLAAKGNATQEADDWERRNASMSEAFSRGQASAWGAAAKALERMLRDG